MISDFVISRLPAIIFGKHKCLELPKFIKQYGNSLLLVTGKGSFCQSTQWEQLQKTLISEKITWQMAHIDKEPSPELIDQIVKQFSENNFSVVVGIGGGSVLDGAKAIAGLIPCQHSIMNYLEGVGPELDYQGPALPFIALPTTAGTGSEATKNAVISSHGENGFKKSFRDESLVAALTIIDPLLFHSCPPPLIAMNGMDALTQLMESYVSTRSNPLTDALAISGVKAVKQGLFRWYRGDEEGAAYMAYAALLSGITLAQTGLGVVHGIASPLGAMFPIPHGVACGSTLATATETNIKAMLEREKANPAIYKYKELSLLLHSTSSEGSLESLTSTLFQWQEELQIPKLSQYGIKFADIPKITANSRGSSMQTNPIFLTDSEISGIIETCM